MLGPLACLITGTTLIVLFIIYLRIHAFLALILTSLIVAFLSDRIPADLAIHAVTNEFGRMMSSIGLLLVFAAIIGKCIMESGAAERIVRGFNRLFGEGREDYSLLGSAFVISIPVFFDAVFYLLAPLARIIYSRRKRDYVKILLMIAAGGTLTHSLVPPTPGPTLVSEALRVPLITTMLIGSIAAILPIIFGGILYVNWINKRMPIVPSGWGAAEEDIIQTINKSDSELPSLSFSLTPFMLPVFLLALSSLLTFLSESRSMEIVAKLSGDKNLVFFIGTLIALALLQTQKKYDHRQLYEAVQPAILSGAVIAFITCAGGAFGNILAAAGIGELISATATNWNVPLILLAYLTAVLIRIAQGSATVAMITTAGIVAGSLETVTIAYHPVYLVCAIGFGATGYSWMNDSGFWIFSKLSGLTEMETLKTWTVLKSILSIVGFLWLCFLCRLIPLV